MQPTHDMRPASDRHPRGKASNTVRAALAACLLISGAAANAAIVLNEGFEDSNLAARGWYDFSTTPTITSAQAYSGGKSMETTFQAGQVFPIGMRHSLPNMSTVYIRYARKYQDGWQWPSVSYGPHDMYLFANAGQYQAPTNTHLTYYVEQNAPGRAHTELKATLQGSSSPFYNYTGFNGPGVVFEAGKWHLIDAMIKMNDPGQSNGELRMWVNGVLQIEKTGLKLRTDQHSNITFNQLFFGPYYHQGSPKTQKFWTDNLIISDAPLTAAAVPLPPAIAFIASGLAWLGGLGAWRRRSNTGC